MIFLTIPICAALMRIKGGGLEYFKIGGGKIISALGFAALCYWLRPEWLSLLGGLGWWIGNKPSLGEIVGAIGGIKGTWNNEVNGWKEGVQRGVFTGACVSLSLWNPAFIIAGALFPVCVYAGVSLEQLRKNQTSVSWYLFELIWGAAFGAVLWVCQ